MADKKKVQIPILDNTLSYRKSQSIFDTVAKINTEISNLYNEPTKIPNSIQNYSKTTWPLPKIAGLSFYEFHNKLRDIIELATKPELLKSIRQSLPIDNKIGTFKDFSSTYSAFKNLGYVLDVVNLYDYHLKAKEALSDINNKDKLYNFYVDSGKALTPKVVSLFSGVAGLFIQDVLIYSDLSHQIGIDKAIVESRLGDMFTSWLAKKLYPKSF